MLTPNAEEYLEAIYRLGGGQEIPVSLSSLADKLGLSAASVNEMVRRLEEQELVRYTPYKGVQLVGEGLCKALSILRRHRLWERFLTDMLNLPWDAVHEEACRLEHAASEEVTERLAELLNHPDSCPHGKPLPPPGCQPIPLQTTQPLSTLEPNQPARVAYISPEEPELLRHVQDLGLIPNANVIVERVAPFEGPLHLRVNDQAQIIGRKVASAIYIHLRNIGDNS